jgi:hypothetical protein
MKRRSTGWRRRTSRSRPSPWPTIATYVASIGSAKDTFGIAHTDDHVGCSETHMVRIYHVRRVRARRPIDGHDIRNRYPTLPP